MQNQFGTGMNFPQNIGLNEQNLMMNKAMQNELAVQMQAMMQQKDFMGNQAFQQPSPLVNVPGNIMSHNLKRLSST